MTSFADKTYRDLAALLAENADKNVDGWMQTLLVLTNSVRNLMDEHAQALVDDALDSAESPFRRIMDEQERELQSVYTSLHAERADNDALRSEVAALKAVSNGTWQRGQTATEKGIAFALNDAETLSLVQRERKIVAIKRVRASVGIGLKEAKDAVESAAVQEAAENFCHAECME